jgi:hypothetical protein
MLYPYGTKRGSARATYQKMHDEASEYVIDPDEISKAVQALSFARRSLNAEHGGTCYETMVKAPTFMRKSRTGVLRSCFKDRADLDKVLSTAQDRLEETYTRLTGRVAQDTLFSRESGREPTAFEDTTEESVAPAARDERESAILRSLIPQPWITLMPSRAPRCDRHGH